MVLVRLIAGIASGFGGEVFFFGDVRIACDVWFCCCDRTGVEGLDAGVLRASWGIGAKMFVGENLLDGGIWFEAREAVAFGVDVRDEVGGGGTGSGDIMHAIGTSLGVLKLPNQ